MGKEYDEGPNKIFKGPINNLLYIEIKQNKGCLYLNKILCPYTDLRMLINERRRRSGGPKGWDE